MVAMETQEACEQIPGCSWGAQMNSLCGAGKVRSAAEGRRKGRKEGEGDWRFIQWNLDGHMQNLFQVVKPPTVGGRGHEADLVTLSLHVICYSVLMLGDKTDDLRANGKHFHRSQCQKTKMSQRG